MLGNGIEKILNKNGKDCLLKNVMGFFSGADLIFANLESPITINDKKYNDDYSKAIGPVYCKVEPKAFTLLQMVMENYGKEFN